MKHSLKVTIAFTMILLVSCSGKKVNKKTEVHDHASMEQEENADKGIVLRDDALNAIYRHYMNLTTALTNDNIAEAKIAANAIEAGAKEIGYAKTLSGPASRITAASNIEGQRIAYSQLSKQLETLIRKEGLSGGQLYVDYCPMALNDEGATWVSSHKQISNPYFGKEMLTCGEVQDTIK